MKTIFVTDDSPTARASISYVLKESGYSVLLAENGVDALTKIKECSNNIELFLCDVNMPKMDGITLVGEIRKIQKCKFTPILMLTTESQESKKMEAKNAGASGWIVKPFEPEQLVGLVSRFVKI
ncbi:MAG: hypothetical protein B6229_00730 [Spirochaetaceae bacterium 4572_7]|nr:MAG: hypothetical protein B6229_00730 [Spirochaetaceae bacterium 4572_7]